MWLSRFFPVILFFITLLEGAKSSPLLAERATPKCTARNIEIVRRTVNDEVYFCKWWLSEYVQSKRHIRTTETDRSTVAAQDHRSWSSPRQQSPSFAIVSSRTQRLCQNRSVPRLL